MQGTYETFAAAAKQHYNSDLTGKLVLTAGLGGMGGAQPLAVKMKNGVSICVEVDKDRIQKRLDTKYLDIFTNSLDEALKLALNAQKACKPLSIGLHGNAADIVPKIAEIGIVPDMVTDQTSAHDELDGYVPNKIEEYEQGLIQCSGYDCHWTNGYETLIRTLEMDAFVKDYVQQVSAKARANMILSLIHI